MNCVDAVAYYRITRYSFECTRETTRKAGHMNDIDTRVQNRQTMDKGTLLNERTAEIAIVQYDNLPHPTWTEWRDIA